MDTHKLEFVASMTVCPSDIKKIKYHLNLANTSAKPLKNILITPLFVNYKSLEMARELTNEGSEVFFDSGGYYVQMGKLSYHELYMPLLNIYKSNRWASVYTLPDHVPTSQDNKETVSRKVQNTIDFSTMFFNEMPDELKPKAMPVVQGHSYKQVDLCLEAYIRLGVNRIGFGSFGTSGANSEINVATSEAVELARYVIEIAHSHGIKVHLFGLGVPALVAMIKGIKADSFDSASWLKSAGFGQIFMPFMRSYNITYKNTVSEFQQGIATEDFVSLRQLTQHECALCKDLASLRSVKMYRAVHNLIVISETVEKVNGQERAEIRAIYENGSIKYRREYEKWLSS